MKMWLLLLACCAAKFWTPQKLKDAYAHQRSDNFFSVIDNNYLSSFFVDRLEENLEKNLKNGVVFLFLLEHIDSKYYNSTSQEWELDKFYKDWRALYGEDPPYNSKNMIFLLFSIEDRKFITQLGEAIQKFVSAEDLDAEVQRWLYLFKEKNYEKAVEEILRNTSEKIKNLKPPAKKINIIQSKEKLSYPTFTSSNSFGSPQLPTYETGRSSSSGLGFNGPFMHLGSKNTDTVRLGNLVTPLPTSSLGRYHTPTSTPTFSKKTFYSPAGKLRATNNHAQRNMVIIVISGVLVLIIFAMIVIACRRNPYVASTPAPPTRPSAPSWGAQNNNPGTFTLPCGHSFGTAMHPEVAQWNSCPVCYRPVNVSPALLPRRDSSLRAAKDATGIFKNIAQGIKAGFSMANWSQPRPTVNLISVNPPPPILFQPPAQRTVFMEAPQPIFLRPPSPVVAHNYRAASPPRSSWTNAANTAPANPGGSWKSWANQQSSNPAGYSESNVVTTAVIPSDPSKPAEVTRGTTGGW